MMWGFTSRRDDRVSPDQYVKSNGRRGKKKGGKKITRGRKPHQSHNHSHGQNDETSAPRTARLTRGTRAERPERAERAEKAERPSNGVRARPEVPISIDHAMNVNETKHGIEVSLDFFKPESREPSNPQRPLSKSVISMSEQIRRRQKVYRTQFSVSFPALHQPTQQDDISAANWRPKDHRIPLLGFSLAEAAYEDVYSLLRNTPVVDEASSVREELKHMNTEIEALEKDRRWLEATWRKATNSIGKTPAGKSKGDVGDWDISRILNSNTLAEEEQVRLQQARGLYLTLHLQNPKAKDAFLTKCGSKSKAPKSKNKKRRAPGDTVTVGPYNCRKGGAGFNVQHISIMSASGASNSAFFISRDAGKAYTWGRLPPRLFRRMKEDSNDPSTDSGELVYLSTGPHGCYYAEFRSGECWWGSAVEDHDFHAIIQDWDVYRVVFGPVTSMDDGCGNIRITNSWIILGRDGRAAWKNLPSRLHHQLEGRLANWAAPAEVALGPGDSYYIRFLDGTVDYCLPAAVAEVCEFIEMNGGQITDIVLHPEISHDFVIRHTELRS